MALLEDVRDAVAEGSEGSLLLDRGMMRWGACGQWNVVKDDRCRHCEACGGQTRVGSARRGAIPARIRGPVGKTRTLRKTRRRSAVRVASPGGATDARAGGAD